MTMTGSSQVPTLRAKRVALLNYFSLFSSFSTLICCALPSVLVLLGMGTTVASLLSGAPWLVSLSRHKIWTFGIAGTLIAIYTQIPITDAMMLVLGFPLGFFLSGIFSGMGAFLSELFPSRIRGSGQGFCYNAGRAVGAICPALIGYMSSFMPLGLAIGYLAVGGYLLVVVTALTLPETRGLELSSETGKTIAH